ncbi:MAG: serine hydrolase domain-containing protein [Candidatus Thorarchaeota archaeon]|jgi:CubicO group peptidase (beta-lactamase class C family)
MRFSGAILFILVSLLLTLQPVQSAQVGDPSQTYPATYVPDTHWESTTPEEQGMSSAVLNEMIQFINESEAAMRGLVVTRNGYIVTEQYWGSYNENTSHHIFSCTKSFTSALIGIAMKEGFLDNVSQNVLDFFPDMTFANPSPLKESMTLEHLLTMTHGLDWNEHNISYLDNSNMYNQMFRSLDPIQFFLDLPMVYTPGEHWVYTTGASHLLSAILQRVTNMTSREFAELHLFGPMSADIGMWSVVRGVNHGGTQLYITPRTMAKLGLLYLNNGTWGDQEILPEDWVIASTSPYVGIWGNVSYGYQWWIDEGHQGYLALGSEGQNIYVNPEYNIVVAITASAQTNQQDLSEEVFRRVRLAVTEYEPPAGGIWPELLQLLTILGVVSVSLVVLVVGVQRRTKG